MEKAPSTIIFKIFGQNREFPTLAIFWGYIRGIINNIVCLLKVMLAYTTTFIDVLTLLASMQLLQTVGKCSSQLEKHISTVWTDSIEARSGNTSTNDIV